ncbi:hypothetical protein GCK72_012755 [Caenorhabditis remanei]|uniref:Uncharacterized protein n=1 Tax=Caenorhabditis remanei TaxID=31234 RepID=A0A6A5GPF4_CAERE|nr:hypothetical protein GCK72_012755 [Caenorhabditis remanei]KAF1756302.1 hypothetical protein GCK72_012755 [Caenorhabditis remanei]
MDVRASASCIKWINDYQWKISAVNEGNGAEFEWNNAVKGATKLYRTLNITISGVQERSNQKSSAVSVPDSNLFL